MTPSATHRQRDAAYAARCVDAGGFGRRSIHHRENEAMPDTTNQPTRSIDGVRDRLLEVFDGLREGRIEVKDAVEINNTAGKIISSAKVQIAYYALRGEEPDIPFIGTPGRKIEARRTPALAEG